jgi:hypothetical protein
VQQLVVFKAFHQQVRDSLVNPCSLPDYKYYLDKYAVDTAFELLRQHVVRRFELWVSNLSGERVCINPLVQPGEGAILNPPQHVGERQLLSVCISTPIYIPAHDKVVGNVATHMPAQHVVWPDLVWLQRGQTMPFPSPHDYITAHIVE